MAKNLNITIPQPCHENWGAMTSAEQGRHCSSCNKVVVDFTTMTDAQLVEYFKIPKPKTCGRFRTDQLDRKIRLRPEEKSLFPFKYLAASLIATGAFWQTAKANDLIDTSYLRVAQLEMCVEDTNDAKTAVVDSCEEATADTRVLIGDVAAIDVPSFQPDTLFAQSVVIYGGTWVSMGVCVPEPTPEFDPDDLSAFKQHRAKPFVGQILEGLRYTFHSKSSTPNPGKKSFNFSFATIVNRLKVKRLF